MLLQSNIARRKASSAVMPFLLALCNLAVPARAGVFGLGSAFLLLVASTDDVAVLLDQVSQ